MSNENGPSTSPQTLPPDYKMVTPAVTSVSYNLDLAKEKEAISERRNIRKGQTAGSYSSVDPDKGAYEKKTQTYKPPFPKPKIGGEIRNLELEEIIRLGKLAQREGFNFTEGADGEISAEIPKDYLAEEEELRQKLTQEEELRQNEIERREAAEKELIEKALEANKRAELLKQLVALSVDFSELNAKTELMLPTISDFARNASLQSRRDAVDGALLTFRNDPTEAKVDSVKEKIEELRKELEAYGAPQAPGNKEMEELKDEILSLTFDVDTEMEEAKTLEEQISDNAVLSGFKNDIERIKILFAALRRSPSADAKKKFDEAFKEYRDTNKKLIEDYIQKYPKQAPVAAAPATPAPATPAAPVTPQKLKEYGGWPNSIYEQKGKGVAAGLYSSRTKTLLDNQEAWKEEKAAFESVFKRYSELIRNVPIKDRGILKPLIDIKNTLVGAIKNEDIASVEALRMEFEEATEAWKSRWQSLLTLRTKEEAIVEIHKNADTLSQSSKDKLKKSADECEDLGQKIHTDIIDGTLKAEDLEKLSKKIDAYKKLVELYKKEEERQKTTFEAVNGVLIEDKLTGEKKAAILRPIKVTPENKDQKIKVIGKPEMTLEEYDRLRSQKEAAKDTMTMTDAILDEWPELSGRFPAGSPMSKEAFGNATSYITYERMFKKNAQAFIGTYATPELDKRTNTVRYVTNKRFQMGTPAEKKLIKEVLTQHGLTLEDQEWEERHASDEQQKRDKEGTIPSSKETFRPAFEKRKSFLGIPYMSKQKNVMKRVDDPGANRLMAEHQPTRLSDVEEYKNLVNMRRRYVRHADFDEMERDLNSLMAHMRSRPNQKRLVEEFKTALAHYEEKVRPFIEGRKAAINAHKLPNEEKNAADIEAIKKTQEAPNAILRKKEGEHTLRKVTALLEKRIEHALAKSKHMSINPKKALLMALLGANVVLWTPIIAEEKAVAAPQKIEQLQKKKMEEFVASYAKELYKDFSSRKSVSELIVKHAPLLIDKDKPASIERVYNLQISDCLDKEEYDNMSNEQQKQVCALIAAAENIAQAVTGYERTRATLTGKQFPHPDNWFNQRGEKLGKYLKEVAEAVNNAV